VSDLAGTGGDEVQRHDDVADGGIHEPQQLPQWQQDPLIRVVQSHSGPMPPPSVLAQYDQVVPGLARDIVEMAKAEQAHRHSLEDVVVHGDRDATRRGQHYGLIALVLMLAIAAYMVSKGYAEPAAWLLGTTVVGVVGVFVTGRVIENRQKSTQPEAGAEDEQPPVA
jgi:uncharacterized membrane protein